MWIEFDENKINWFHAGKHKQNGLTRQLFQHAHVYVSQKSIFRGIYYLFICKYNQEEWKCSFQQQQNHCVNGVTVIWRKSSLLRSTTWLQPLACLLLNIKIYLGAIMFRAEGIEEYYRDTFLKHLPFFVGPLLNRPIL